MLEQQRRREREEQLQRERIQVEQVRRVRERREYYHNPPSALASSDIASFQVTEPMGWIDFMKKYREDPAYLYASNVMLHEVRCEVTIRGRTERVGGTVKMEKNNLSRLGVLIDGRSGLLYPTSIHNAIVLSGKVAFFDCTGPCAAARRCTCGNNRG